MAGKRTGLGSPAVILRNLFLAVGAFCLLLGLLQVLVPSTDNDPTCDPALFPGHSNQSACHLAWQSRGTVSAACGIAGLAFMTGAVAAAVSGSRPRAAPVPPPMAPPAGAPPYPPGPRRP